MSDDEITLPVSVKNIKERIEEIHRKKAEKEREKSENIHRESGGDSESDFPPTLFSRIKKGKEEKSSSTNENFVDDDFGYPKEKDKKEKTSLTSSKRLAKIGEENANKVAPKKEMKFGWNNNKSENKKNTHVKQVNSHSVNLITESVKTASYIINTSSDNVDIGNNFAKFLKRQKSLSEITQEKLNLNFSSDDQKSIEVELNSAISDVLVDIHSMKDIDIIERFSMLCDQVMTHRDFWRGNERVAPLLPIRAKAATFEASLECWLALEEYPFSHDADKDMVKMFLMVITLARDVAQNWDEELDSIERQQLYVNIIGVIAKTARKKWEFSCLNNLDNSCSTIDDIIDSNKKTIRDMFPSNVFGSQVGKDLSDSILRRLIDMISMYEEGFDHLASKTSTRHKKSILLNITSSSNKVIKQYISEDGLDFINKKINSHGIEVLFDDIMEKIEIEIESSPPYIVNDFTKYHNELKDGIAQMWGASQGIYKFRS